MPRSRKSQGRSRSPDTDLYGVEPGPLASRRLFEQEDEENEKEEGGKMIVANTKKSLAVLAREIRTGLHQNGTNVVLNDNDPMGDGDQSVIEGQMQRKYHRLLFRTCGDHFNCIQEHALSPFADAVLRGRVPEVRAMLKEADAATTGTTTDDGTPSPELVALLETRETSMRLSPILMIVAMAKNLVDAERRMASPAVSYVGVAKLLLKYGARPDARDVVGKTVFHYGAGAYASEMTLAVADLCLQAQEGGSHLFGKQVLLVNLSNESMNGQQGIALGFDVDTGRRTVSLPVGNSGRRKVVAVKPENLRLADVQEQREVETRPFVRLCDIPDRHGIVSFTEVIREDRADVAEFLLERKARLDVVDPDGASPLSMSMSPEAQIVNSVCRLINERVSATARRERRKLCSGCGKDENDAAATFDLCSGCKAMRYCSRECQLRHWRTSHKVECRDIQSKKEMRVVLGRPPAGVTHVNFWSVRIGPPVGSGELYRIPQNIRTGQKFTIKVMASAAGEESSHLLIHNEARDCSFFLKAGQGGYKEVFDALRAEKATSGLKTFMKALFDEDGNCVAFPGDTTIHTW